MRKRFLVVVLMMVSISLIMANGTSEATGPVKVGAVAARSGDNASLGEWQKNGALIAIDEINDDGGVLGRQLSVIFEDSQGNPSQAVSALNKLLFSDKVVAVIGDPQSSSCLAMMPVIADAEIPLLPHGTNPSITEQGNEWVFRTRASDTVKFGYLAEYLNEKGYERIAILHDAADYGVGGKESVVNRLKDFNATPVAIEQWTPGDRDFNSQLITIREQNPDVLIVIGPMVDMGLAMKQARQMGMDVQFAGGAGIETETTWDSSAGASKDVIFTAGFLPVNPDPTVQAFLAEYQKRYDAALPNDFAATGYDAVKLIAKAINDAGSTDPQALQDALRNIEFVGVQGQFEFNEKGEGLHTMQVGRVIGRSEFVAID